MEEIKSEEEELINQLKPKISEYFTRYQKIYIGIPMAFYSCMI